jgi:GT2 family glycosyltransferase
MTNRSVTLVVTQRERFSCTERSLQSIYKNTSTPFELIYVSGRTPPGLSAYLEEASLQHGFTLLSSPHYLSPNQARNLAIGHVKTKFVVFLDNDVIVSNGWLEALLECAESTGAWLVGPLYLTGETEQQLIHMAGGSLHWGHSYVDTTIAALPCALARKTVSFLEFHCLLARTEVFDRLGPLDEELTSIHEHIDISMKVRSAGGIVYLEPASVISYLAPPPFEPSDLPFYMLRWSDFWNWKSVSHFADKWGTTKLNRAYIWGRHHRKLAAGADVVLGSCARPLEQAELAIAGFISVGREFCSVTMTDANMTVVDHVPSTDPCTLMNMMPHVLERSTAKCLSAFLRPSSGNGKTENARPPYRPVLVQVDDLSRVQLSGMEQEALLTLETGADRYQCWFALDHGTERPGDVYQRIASHRRVDVGEHVSLPLPGSRSVPVRRAAANGDSQVKLLQVKPYHQVGLDKFLTLCPAEPVSMTLEF